MNYGSEVWGFSKATAVERVHLQFCKRLLGVKKSTQNDFIYGELGRTTCIIRRYLLIIKFWFKILSIGSTKYIKLVYHMMLNDLDRNPALINFDWTSLLEDLLCSMRFNVVWQQQGVGNFKNFISVFKQRLTDTFIQNWHSRIENSSRALSYRSFATFQFQPYLDNVNVSKYLFAFSKLLLSSHRLEVEAGRWVRPIRIPFEDRKCILHKFIELINTSNKRCLRRLCTFIFHAFKVRTELLYNNRN